LAVRPICIININILVKDLSVFLSRYEFLTLLSLKLVEK
jgi:hypothetical protein